MNHEEKQRRLEQALNGTRELVIASTTAIILFKRNDAGALQQIEDFEDGEQVFAFKLRRPDDGLIGQMAGAIFTADDNLTNTQALMDVAMRQGSLAQTEYLAWCKQNGRTPRPDTAPMPNMAEFSRISQDVRLRAAMVKPSLDEMGGVDALGDFRTALLEAINNTFGPLKAGEPDAETIAVAETFHADEGPRVGSDEHAIPAALPVGLVSDEPEQLAQDTGDQPGEVSVQSGNTSVRTGN